MTDTAIQPALNALPPELLRMIIDDPADVCGIQINESDPSRAKWLPIKQDWWHVVEGNWPYPEANPMVLQSQLRSLSQVCRSLRAFTLPLLWAVVHVEKIEQLGRLRETLRASPGIAPLIRSFVFMWSNPPDGLNCANFLPKTDSLLDINFRDRGAYWNGLVESGCEVKRDFPQFGSTYPRHIIHKGVKLTETGEAPLIEGLSPFKESSYDRDAPRVNSNGPDGKGEDKLIKDAEQLRNCLVEIIGSLTSLETLGWCSLITLIPVEVFDSLAKLTTLKALTVKTTTLRRNVQALPFWKLAGELRELCLFSRHGATKITLVEKTDEERMEQLESTFTSFEPPNELPTTQEGIVALGDSIAARTIIAAGRAGHLKRFGYARENGTQAPFNVRTLLQFWVGIEGWGFEGQPKPWHGAAMSLRPILSHASLWLGTAVGQVSFSTPREDLLLTGEEVQTLQAYFDKEGIPKVVKGSYKEPFPISRYLPWLAEDAELAQQVADAWNEVVRRGEVDLGIRCCCAKCRRAAKIKAKQAAASRSSDEDSGYDDEDSEIEDVGPGPYGGGVVIVEVVPLLS